MLGPGLTTETDLHLPDHRFSAGNPVMFSTHSAIPSLIVAGAFVFIILTPKS